MNLILTSIALIVLGVILDTTFPAIKKLWTISFAIFSTGVSLLFFAVLVLAVRKAYLKSLFSPFKTFVGNALLAFVIAIMTLNILDIGWISSDADALSIRGYVFNLLTMIFPKGVFTSFLFTPSYCAFLYWLLFFMQWRKLYWKV